MNLPADNPPSSPLVVLISIYDIYALGLRHIHAELEASGYNADLIFFQSVLRKEGFKYTYGPRPPASWPGEADYRVLSDLLKERRPRVVGISLRSFALELAQEITGVVRNSCDALVVWGGIHPTLLPEECIEHADVVCVGEGEGPLKDIARAVRDSEPLDEIENLWIKSGSGKVIKNPLRPLIQDLDAVAFPRLGNEGKFFIRSARLVRRDPYLNPDRPILYSILASRGCPFRCSFCSNDVLRGIYEGLGKYYRARSPENIIEELKKAKAHLQIQTVGFQEENFSTRPDWYEELFELYKKEIGVPFTVELHPNLVNERFAKAMKDAGGSSVAMGVQSGSERIRSEVFLRPGSNEKIKNAVELFHEQGIALWLDFIMNSPFDESSDLQQTLELMLSFPRPYNLKMYSMCYLPRTSLAERALDEGIITEDMLDQYSKLGFTQLMPSYHNSLNAEHAFYVSLAWMDVLKISKSTLKFTFFANNFRDGKHLVPREVIRFLSNSSFLKRHPKPLHAFLALVLGPGNRVLGVARRTRKLLRTAGRRD
ncbi:MAG: radical SAM protein [bacterium]